MKLYKCVGCPFKTEDVKLWAAHGRENPTHRLTVEEASRKEFKAVANA